MKIAGYCKLCRSKEVELFGTVLNNAGKRHQEACKKARCKHPAFYLVPRQKGDNDMKQIVRS